MRRPSEDLDRDIFAQSLAQPEATPAAGPVDTNARRTRHGRRGMIHYGVVIFMREKPGADAKPRDWDREQTGTGS